MDLNKVISLRENLQKYLETFSREHNLSIKVGSGSFSTSNLIFKVECAEISDEGNVLDQNSESFKINAFSLGLKPEDLGK